MYTAPLASASWGSKTIVSTNYHYVSKCSLSVYGA